MKKQINRALALIIAGIILGASQLAPAQTPERVFVNVPFDFSAGDRQLPAGRYTLRRVRLDSSAVIIESEDGRRSAVVLTNPSEGGSRLAKLTFRQYGDSYFLAGIFAPGAAGGREVTESKHERGLRRELAKAGAEAKTVAVQIR